MANGEIIEKIASIDEQIHDLRKIVLENGSQIKKEECPDEPAAIYLTSKPGHVRSFFPNI